jgi:steroid delta-isomerase-like uncharacterized protein
VADGGTVARNKQVVLDWFDAVWHSKDPEAYDRFANPNATLHLAGFREPLRGIDAVKRWAAAYQAGFPDVQFTVEELIGERDYVVMRWRSHGTHTAEYLGLPPTQRSFELTALQMSRIVDDKIDESWLMFDPLGVLQQLGMFPSLPPPRALVLVLRFVGALRRLVRRR